jgi:hypothetical protein
VQGEDEVDPLVEVLAVLIGEDLALILSEPMLQDVVVDLLRVLVGSNPAHLVHFGPLLTLGLSEGEAEAGHFLVGVGVEKGDGVRVDKGGVEVVVNINA